MTGVKSGEPADQANIRSGDVIRKIDGQIIKNLNDFKAVYEKLNEDNKKTIFTELIRGGNPYFAVIKLDSKHKTLKNGDEN